MTLSQGLGSHWPEYAMEAAGLGVNERFTRVDQRRGSSLR